MLIKYSVKKRWIYYPQHGRVNNQLWSHTWKMFCNQQSTFTVIFDCHDYSWEIGQVLCSFCRRENWLRFSSLTQQMIELGLNFKPIYKFCAFSSWYLLKNARPILPRRWQCSLNLHWDSLSHWRHLKEIENCILPAGILERKLCLGVKDKRMNKVGVCFLRSHHVGTRVGAVSRVKSLQNCV